MHTRTVKNKDQSGRSAASKASQEGSVGGQTANPAESGVENSRPENTFQRKLQAMAAVSPRVEQMGAIQEMVGKSTQLKPIAQLQAMAAGRSGMSGSLGIASNPLKTNQITSPFGSDALQKVEIKAKQGELEEQEEFQRDCDMIYGMLKSQVLGQQVLKRGLSMYNFDGSGWDKYLSETFPQTYGAKNQEGRKGVIDNLKMRAEDENLGNIELSSEADIEDKLSPLKACVITALLYAEGGSLLGAKSVEGLHNILMGRFPNTYGQYSDENVIPHLYSLFGYTKYSASKKVKEEVKSYTRGMISVGGHMIGFAEKSKNTYELRDNEGNPANANSHKYGNSNATEVWSK